jgi:hypothetical protein
MLSCVEHSEERPRVPKTGFKTNPISLEELLGDCRKGKLQLPDFQRSWVWDEDRIQSLIASVSRGFPIGALMTLATSQEGSGVVFARRPIEGAPESAVGTTPVQLLLDGQQRMTSLYQTCIRQEPVKTITAKKKLVRRWFYIDIRKAMSQSDQDLSVFWVPEDKRITSDFGKKVELDLSTPALEYAQLAFPVNCVFDWDDWQDGFTEHWANRPEAELFKQFRKDVLKQNFGGYQVPVISLDHDTTHEAVCVVFEKVNTGGKPLDAFELLTAIYAAKGHRLRDDWLGTDDLTGLQGRLASFGRVGDQDAGVLGKVASTDVLQAITLLHTKALRAEKIAAGVKERDLSAVRGTRQSLLELPLDAYLKYRPNIEEGYRKVAKFLLGHCIHRVIDLPYQTQLVPLAAIFAELGREVEQAGHLLKIGQWYWCGIFGELYGSAVESRMAKDVVEVLDWLKGGPEPTTVKDGLFKADRLATMRTRLSAAYKGVHALLMREGAKDFRTGQGFDVTVFFGEGVDIHHIFPEAWCKSHGLEPKTYDTVVNKTPLTYRTNRIIGGVAPSQYLARLESGGPGDPPIPRALLDKYLESHCIPVAELRADDFEGFMLKRRLQLLERIGNATGRKVIEEESAPPDEGEELTGEMERDALADQTALATTQ